METYGIELVPVIVALVAVVSQFGIPKRWLPLVALVLGVIGGIVYLAPGDLPQAILAGIVAGLSATGTYSGVKNTFEKRNPELSQSEIDHYLHR